MPTPCDLSLSIITVCHDMPREAPRTLFSMSRSYQRDIADLRYEVIALDHGSTRPLDPAMVQGFGPEFRYRRVETDAVSPVAAINDAVKASVAPAVAIHVDGARILSPGVLAGIAAALQLYPSAFVHTLGFHLGPGPQSRTMLTGYDQRIEDGLLTDSGWRDDGYRLFDISALAVSSAGGWFSDLQESNCFALPRRTYLDMGGLHPGFTAPGGGLCNLDFYNRAMQHPALVPVRLLGEGSFHQFHGGVATNAPPAASPWDAFQREHAAIYGRPWTLLPGQNPMYLGRLHRHARRFLAGAQGVDAFD
jgi:hypothetical protein